MHETLPIASAPPAPGGLEQLLSGSMSLVVACVTMFLGAQFCGMLPRYLPLSQRNLQMVRALLPL